MKMPFGISMWIDAMRHPSGRFVVENLPELLIAQQKESSLGNIDRVVPKIF